MDASLQQDDLAVYVATCQRWASHCLHITLWLLAGTITSASDLDNLRVAQLIHAAATQATVRVLGMTRNPLPNNAVWRFNGAFGVRAFRALWSSTAPQQQAWRFWPSWAVRAPLHAVVTETDRFDVMFSNSEPSTPRCTSEAQEVQGTAGCEAADGASVHSDVFDSRVLGRAPSHQHFIATVQVSWQGRRRSPNQR